MTCRLWSSSPSTPVAQRKAKTLVVRQSMSLDVSAGFWRHPKEVGSKPSKVSEYSPACPSRRMGELASEGEGKQAKSKSFLLGRPFVWTATRRCGPGLGWVF